MSRLKIPRPSKYVLVRNGHGLWVLSREWYTAHVLRNPKERDAKLVAESNDREELERFRALTDEET